MKVAVFTETYLPQTNGIVSCVQDSIKQLSKDNEIVLFAPGGETLTVEQPSKRVKIYWMPASPSPFYEGYKIASTNYKRIRDILKKENPDVVHAHTPLLLGLDGIFIAKRMRLPVIVTYHAHIPDYVPYFLVGKPPEVLNKLILYTVKKMIKLSLSGVDKVIAPTRELAQELRSYGLNNVIYIQNGLDFGRLRKNRKLKASFRVLHPIPLGKKVILYVGRLSFEKKIDLIIKAFSMIEKKDSVLLIAGKGPYLQNLKNLAESLGIQNIIFTGYIRSEYLASAYESADLFVSASDSETFGLTLVEAMYLGRPVIGVNKLGASELIKNGKTGILVEPDNIPELAHAMEALLHNARLCSQMGKAGRVESAKYSIENSVAKTIGVYKNLVKGYWKTESTTVFWIAFTVSFPFALRLLTSLKTASINK